MNTNEESAEQICDLYQDTQELFSHGPLLQRVIQYFRPSICPFHRLLALVPKGSSVLDVGCGSGLFLGLLMKRVGLRSALGFDSSKPAIKLATMMRENLPTEMASTISFEHRNANQSWPDGAFDVVSMIDIMHHVPPQFQREVFMQALDHVAPNGLLLYKDMADHPSYLAFANKMHDLIMAHQWINYASISQVKSWAAEAGLQTVQESQCRLFWYAHEWVVFRKTNFRNMM